MATVNIRGVELTTQPFSDMELASVYRLARAIETGDGLDGALKGAYLSLRRIFGADIDQFWNLEVPDHPGTILHAQEFVGLSAALSDALEADPNYGKAAPAPVSQSTAPKGFGDLVKERVATPDNTRIMALEAELAQLRAAGAGI